MTAQAPVRSKGKVLVSQDWSQRPVVLDTSFFSYHVNIARLNQMPCILGITRCRVNQPHMPVLPGDTSTMLDTMLQKCEHC